MKKIQTSVLMSVYKNDDPAFLEMSLKSIYDDQTRKPDEIIVIFDGKLTDELYSVLENFRKGKENIVYYYPQSTNHGLGEALRVGSLLCKGDYIFRMDADDISDPKRFERQLAYIEQHPNCDVLGTDIAEFQSSITEKMRVRSCPNDEKEIIKMAKHRNPINHVSVCIKKEALMKCGGYETLLLLEDYYLWLKMISNGFHLANLKETLVYVRVGNGFLIKRRSSIRIKGWRKIQKYMIEHKMISHITAWFNMIYVIVFTYSPAFIKNIIYNNFLRQKPKYN